MQLQLTWTVSKEETTKAVQNLIKFINNDKNAFGLKIFIIDDSPDIEIQEIPQNEIHN